MYILCHDYASIVWYRIDGHKGNFGHLDTLQFKELGASKGSCEAASTLQVPAHVTLQWCGFCTSDAVHHGASSRSHFTEISEIRYRALRKPLASSRIDIDQMQKRLTMTTMTTMMTMRMRMRVMVMVMMMMAMVAMKWSNPVAIFWLHTLAFMQIFLNPK